jgi:DNA-binding transcriptional ArsR family regulator
VVFEVAQSGPDPTRIVTPDDLARELALLRSRAARGTRSVRVSVADLAERVGEPKSTIHAYLTGRRLAPAEVLDRIVIALGSTAAEQRAWAEAWYRVGAHRATTSHIVDGAPLRPTVPHQLPMTADNFVGRAAQMRELDEMLARGGTLAAVSGTAGVGKTALVVHWANSRSEHFTDGQLYLDLHGFDAVPPMRPEQAIARLLRGLGVACPDLPIDVDEHAALYRSLLSGRRMLIVLDNAHDTEQVRALLPGTRSSTVVVTSRNSLSALVARDGAQRLELDVLPLADATELLRALIGRDRNRPRPEADAPELVEMAERCARLPLALRIAAELAGRRRALPLDALCTELAAGNHELDLLEADDDPHTALRAVFSWSYQCLPEAVARAFRFIGLHGGLDLTPDDLAAMLDTSAAEAMRLLDALTRAHIVEQRVPGRYAMHDLLRCYAEELSLATDAQLERAAATARLRKRHPDRAGNSQYPGFARR